MTAMMTEKLEVLMGEEEFVKNLVACATEEETRAMLAAEGIELTDEDWNTIVTNGAEKIQALQSEGEMDEEALDEVAGGKIKWSTVLVGTAGAVLSFGTGNAVAGIYCCVGIYAGLKGH